MLSMSLVFCTQVSNALVRPPSPLLLNVTITPTLGLRSLNPSKVAVVACAELFEGLSQEACQPLPQLWSASHNALPVNA